MIAHAVYKIIIVINNFIKSMPPGRIIARADLPGIHIRALF